MDGTVDGTVREPAGTCGPGPARGRSGTYHEARADFLQRAATLHAPMFRYVHPHHPQLSTDVVTLGPRGGPALVVVSGTHGIEGHAGSAIQRQYLAPLSEAGVRVVLVHALNPYGFAHDRRVNEDNVDVNRNFHDYPYVPQNRDYRTIHDLLVPADWEGPEHGASEARLLELVGELGLSRVQHAITGGQHEYPDGLFYGGTAATWSNRTLRQVVREHVLGADRVAYIDLHTGLGARAAGEVIFRGGDDADAFDRARRWYGPGVTRSEDGTSSSTPINGNTARAVVAELGRDVVTTAITLEFGTLDGISVLRALQGDNWSSLAARRDHPGYAAVRDAMVAAFAPDDEDWWAPVLARAGVVFDSALAGLLGVERRRSGTSCCRHTPWPADVTAMSAHRGSRTGAGDDPGGPCPFCGVDLALVDPPDAGARVRADTATLIAVLTTAPNAALRTRASAESWSAAEYAGHLGDVYTLFAQRLTAMVTHDAPALTVWDHDRRVAEQRYHDADVAQLVSRLTASSEHLGEVAAALGPADLDRIGWRGSVRRSVREVLARAVHEAHHHLRDAVDSVAAAGGAE